MAVNLVTVIPGAMPANPSPTELAACPMPHGRVTQKTFAIDHFRAFPMTTKGR